MSKMNELSDQFSQNFKCDISQIGQKVWRAPQIIKDKLEIGYQFKDKNFDQIQDSFNTIHDSITTLNAECERFSVQISNLMVFTQNINKGFQEILSKNLLDSNTTNIPLTPNSGIVSPIAAKECASDPMPGTKNFNFSKYVDRFQTAVVKIKSDQSLFQSRVIAPLAQIKELSTRIQKPLEERKNLILDINSFSSKVERYNQRIHSNELTLKGEQKRIKYDKKLEEVKFKYETLNSVLKVELQIFFDLFRQFLASWFPLYLYLTYSIYYNLYQFLGNCPEVRKLLEKSGFSSLAPVSSVVNTSRNLVEDFHINFDSVMEQLQSLNVINFKRLYAQVYAGNLEDSTVANSYQGPVPTLYATVIYDYEPQFNDPQYLTIKEGDIIQVITQSKNGWWYGMLLRTKTKGLFPQSYIQVQDYDS
ncbi:HGL258Cp [Eremothecium sinecaudum]|uniref:HGL258Cp n=1 Tax=Eremothecium sinecaudum TaxID=45286 RepID=A0A120K2N4_9SACH|nr:HGL258Cp [Eremothecium sinecaudum]AMD22082.1 HGL258Cp [Eremothecium sinecaudum]